jgi:hypothetical protein
MFDGLNGAKILTQQFHSTSLSEQVFVEEKFDGTPGQ